MYASILDFIRAKAVTDTAMAFVLKTVEANPEQKEAILALIFENFYDTGKSLVGEVKRLRKLTTGKVILSEVCTPPSSTP